MNTYAFTLNGAALTLLPSGAVYWEAQRLLVVSDLHLGRSERYARNAGALLPPYETRDTLTRLEADIETVGAQSVLCLGDSFDDLAAADGLDEETHLWLTRLMAGRDWIWVEGNHDPGPVDLGGQHLAELHIAPLTFRHIAEVGAQGELSGHYHPKVHLSARGRSRSRACLVHDDTRAILPAFGTYTGGMRVSDPIIGALMGDNARAVMIGTPLRCVPLSKV